MPPPVRDGAPRIFTDGRMLKPKSLLARLGGGQRGTREERRRLRQAADAARDRGAWAEAASLYRDYLALAPKDGGLWVQLGHCLKEAGSLEDAHRAYEESLRVRPGDADALLSLGHLAKLQGDPAQAARCYTASFLANGNVHAREELSNPALDPYLPEDARDVLRKEAQRAAAALSTRCRGLRIVDATAIAALGDERYDIVGGETCIAFAADGLAADTRIAALFLHATADDAGKPAAGRLFIDFIDDSVPPGTITMRAGAASPVLICCRNPSESRGSAGTPTYVATRCASRAWSCRRWRTSPRSKRCCAPIPRAASTSNRRCAQRRNFSPAATSRRPSACCSASG
jgi:hypothetical protein